jgi:hypothetical protein
MPDVWSKFDATGIVLLVTVVSTLLFCLFLTAAVHWHKVRESDNATKLKLEMLDRGMSADEIKTVLDAGPSRPPAVSVSWKKSGVRQ